MNYNSLHSSDKHELVDIYSQDGICLGAVDRAVVHDMGYIHYAIHCWVWGVYNGKQVIAFQKRKQTKKLFPGKYDVAAAGHYLSGEYGLDGLRELEEELGLPRTSYSIRFFETRSCSYRDDSINNNELCNVFFCRLNSSLSAISFLREELDDVIVGYPDDFLALFRGQTSRIQVFSVNSQKEISVTFDEFVVEYRDYFINSVLSLRQALDTEYTNSEEKKYFTFVMIKPDALERMLVPQITQYFTSKGYSIELIDIVAPKDEKIYEHYSEKIAEEGDAFRRGAYKYFHGKLVVPIVISSKQHSIVQDVRGLIGYKDPSVADKESVRGKWGTDSMKKSEAEGRCCENLIHASDSTHSFKRETMLWFRRIIAEKYLMY